MKEDKLIKVLYTVYLLLAIVLGFAILFPNSLIKDLSIILVGIFFIITSSFGLITKSSFIGRAIIFPQKSNNKTEHYFVLTLNYIIAIIGIILIVLDLIKII
ncbi:hypothetical protein EDC18_1193 [Natranaerovirga pectinivora]|uniref:Uncharacterized protein n=1 Tax=Natranaerovirga pectinivora TaxID=682400 RepID=A0A4R3MIR3_9FIRM|nr:hypothetical protein [Natranaerovirga pectinivora]TCT11615.1 hypothetical protein EDC18_1193 [Natranaerovirga pectinivora]